MSDKPIDSLMLYKNLPLEKSLELYTDVDTLNKTVDMMVHIGIFKVEKQKFAVVIDSASTTFFKFEKGSYKKIFSAAASLAFSVTPIQYKDFNNDGYTDILYSVPSGGSYGDDNFLLFYNPETKNLLYKEEPELRNAEVKGNTISTSGLFWRKTYTIKGYSLLLQQETEYLQSNNDDKKVVYTFNDLGKQISRDTLIVKKDE